ncbi:hypothetical protein ACFU7D_19515 [Nocardioides sp. NPDC057577]|uniref:hypothetical protein n=1 Tax=Nocardioides sp. NPDC057577 TaxID=3346171 RepID=UPI00366DFFCA
MSPVRARWMDRLVSHVLPHLGSGHLDSRVVDALPVVMPSATQPAYWWLGRPA